MQGSVWYLLLLGSLRDLQFPCVCGLGLISPGNNETLVICLSMLKDSLARYVINMVNSYFAFSWTSSLFMLVFLIDVVPVM